MHTALGGLVWKPCVPFLIYLSHWISTIMLCALGAGFPNNRHLEAKGFVKTLVELSVAISICQKGLGQFVGGGVP